jgi:polar amino acid transport system ATP-binding protein
LTSNFIIDIQNVSKHFGRLKAVDGVTLQVRRGEVVVVIGPSGSGKSTLLRCINHLETPTAGHIVVDNIPLDKTENINKVRAEVGIVFQLFNLFPHLTALDKGR